MARTIQEIVTSMGTLPAGITETPNGEMSIWRDMAARAIQLFEYVLDLFRIEIDTKLDTKQYGTIQWYIEKSYEYQHGYDLAVSNDGVIGYTVEDSEAKIVTRSAVFSQDNFVYMKVAKTENDTLAPLTGAELTGFMQYINALKPAGIKLGVISEFADKLTLSADIYIRPLFTSASVSTAISQALLTFRNQFEFNGIVNISDIYNVLDDLSGAEAAILTKLSWRESYQTQPPIPIERQKLVSGYFIYEAINIRIRNTEGQLLTTLTEL